MSDDSSSSSSDKSPRPGCSGDTTNPPNPNQEHPPIPSSDDGQRPRRRLRPIYVLQRSSRTSIPASSFRPREPEESSASEIVRRPHERLRDFLARKKALLQNLETPEQILGDTVKDPYEKASLSAVIVRGKTGLILDCEMLHHRCEWDRNYPENPARLQCIVDRLNQLELTPRCEHIRNLVLTDLFQKMQNIQDEALFFKLHQICMMGIRDMEHEASLYDAIYFNDKTFECAKRALSGALNLANAIAKGEVQNGFAVIRPPGHHAMRREFNGYCYFNNVAITADYLITSKIASKVLIIDFDVHHGQGIQQAFYHRNDVLYFSIHRYENGAFWPNLMESNFNFIGVGDGQGYNINVPLNETGMGDAEYLAIFMNILLPIAYEFNPEFVLVSGGYDAAVGCPEGQMLVTPACYQHLIQMLTGLASGRIEVCLEGGYFPPSLADGVSATVKGLLDDPAPMLDRIVNIHPQVIDVMASLKRLLVPFWNCMKVNRIYEFEETSVSDRGRMMEIKYCGNIPIPPYQTRNCYPTIPEQTRVYFEMMVLALREKGIEVNAVNLPVCYFYDEAMLLHRPVRREGEARPVYRPECPERIMKIIEKLEDMGLLERMQRVFLTRRDYSEYNPHSEAYLEELLRRPDTQDVYTNEFTRAAIDTAVCGLLNVVDAVMTQTARSGVAIIRPPGHHAEFAKASGFCLVNNVAIAANYLTTKYGLERVMIIDFDVHHGNGTQQMFYTSKNVLYLSIHRYDDGKYFPHGTHGNYTHDGYGNGRGYNVNIPFSKKKMGNSEYMAAYLNIVLPVAYSYQPQFILVSAGFDAGVNDPLGGYNVTPEAFGHMVNLLKPLACGRIVLALEGGYNLATVSYSMAMCTKALLGDPLPPLDDLFFNLEDDPCELLCTVARHFQRYFPIFKIMRPLPCVPILYKKVDTFENCNVYDEFLALTLDMVTVLDSQTVKQEFDRLNHS